MSSAMFVNQIPLARLHTTQFVLSCHVETRRHVSCLGSTMNRVDNFFPTSVEHFITKCLYCCLMPMRLIITVWSARVKWRYGVQWLVVAGARSKAALRGRRFRHVRHVLDLLSMTNILGPKFMSYIACRVVSSQMEFGPWRHRQLSADRADAWKLLRHRSQSIDIALRAPAWDRTWCDVTWCDVDTPRPIRIMIDLQQ